MMRRDRGVWAEAIGRSRGLFAILLQCIAYSLMVAVSSSSALAGTERFDYDPLGRLIRVIDEKGRITEYVYDPAGNILEVRTSSGTTANPPSVTAVNPTSLRRGTSIQVQVTGSGFTGVQLTSPESRLAVSELQLAPTSISFRLTAAIDATLGARTFTLSNAAGAANFSIRVDPLLPRIEASPNPLAVPPDSRDRRFTVRLSNTDTIAHTVNLSTLDATVATVAPASLAFSASSQELTATIKGLKDGLTTLQLVSPTLGTVLVPVYVTPEFAGINSSYAQSVGVLKDATAVPKETLVSPIVSPLVGLAFGRYVEKVDPSFVVVGATAKAITVTGAGLGDVTGVQVRPNDGLTVGSITRAADGKSVRFDVSAASDAATTMRQVVLLGPNTYPPITPDADRLNVVKPDPVVTSVEPIVLARGAAGVAFVIRGRNLQGVNAITLLPPGGVAVGVFPQVSADGTEIRTAISVASIATLGTRTVVVNTASGSSDVAASSANTLNVVEQAGETVSPVTSPTVSVLKDAAPAANQTPTSLTSGLVGIAKGAVVTSIEPSSGTIGASMTLTLRGSGLSAVDRLTFVPPDGLTVGSVSAASDSLSVGLSIAETAPQTVRGVGVYAGTTEVPFADAAAAVFRVTPRQPVIDSVEPIQVQIGAPAISLVVRGRNFQNALSISVVPGGGVEIQAVPTVGADGTVATVTFRALSGATVGPRAVVLTTPAGSTSSAQTVANTVTLVPALGAPVTPLIAPLVGIDKAATPQPGGGVETLLVSPTVSVQKDQTVTPGTVGTFAISPAFVVAKGVVGLKTTASPLIRGGSGTLTVSGIGLNSVTAVETYPTDGVTVGTVQASSDGASLTVPVTISANAATGGRQLVLRAGTEQIVFVDPAGDLFAIAAGAPRIDSVNPIVMFVGESVTLTIRGENLSLARAVTVEPTGNLHVGTISSINAAGTELTVSIAAPSTMGEGTFLIRVITPGGVSSGTLAPSNTLNVYLPP